MGAAVRGAGDGVDAPAELGDSVALALGAVAALHLCALVYRLRAMRSWFALELRVLVLLAVMAVAVALGGFCRGRLGWYGYVWTFRRDRAGSAGGRLAADRRPDLVPKTREAVNVAYGQSALARVNQDADGGAAAAAVRAGAGPRCESLSLATVAEMLGLSARQVSELVDTAFGIGFCASCASTGWSPRRRC